MYEKVYILDPLESDSKYNSAQLDSDLFDKLDVKVGNILELTNIKTASRITVVIASQIKGDSTICGIRLTYNDMRFLGVNKGDLIKIRKLDHQLAYLVKFIGINGSEIYGSNSLELHSSSKLVKSLNGIRVSKDQVIDTKIFGKLIKLKVVYCSPDLECVIHDATRIQIEKIDIDDPEVQERLKTIMKHSSYIKLDMLKRILSMDIEHFTDSVFKWQKELHFTIKEGFLYFKSEINDSFEILDRKYTEWFSTKGNERIERKLVQRKIVGQPMFHKKLYDDDYRSIVESLAKLGDMDAIQHLKSFSTRFF